MRQYRGSIKLIINYKIIESDPDYILLEGVLAVAVDLDLGVEARADQDGLEVGVSVEGKHLFAANGTK